MVITICGDLPIRSMAVRVLLVVIVCVVAMTQSFGVLVVHDHADVIGDGGRHTHSFVTDAHGHHGHAEDLIPAEEPHGSDDTVARGAAASVLLVALLLVVVGGVSRAMDDAAPLAGPRRSPAPPPRRRSVRLALLTILRV